MRLYRDGSEPRRGVFRIKTADGRLSPLVNLGQGRQVIRQWAEDELRYYQFNIDQARKKAKTIRHDKEYEEHKAFHAEHD